MFALKPRKETEIAVRIVLIAVTLFNTFAPVPGLTHAALAQSSEPSETLPETVTETSLAEPITLATETPVSITATATPVPEVTSTVPPVSSPTAVSYDTKNKAPALILSANPDFIKPGNDLTFHWEITGVSLEKHQFVLQLTIPGGLSLASNYDGEYDETTRTLTISIDSLSGEVLLNTNEASRDASFEASLMEADEANARASLFVPYKEQFTVVKDGGLIEALGGKVKVEFPADALPEKATVQIGKPAGDDIPAYPLLGGPFEITAHGQASGQELKHFEKDLFLYVSYADLNIPPEQEDNLHVYWYNPDSQEWEPLATAVNKETKTLEARTDHFTVFDVNIDYWQAAQLPTVDSFQVSNFTGAGTYSMPIQVPAGPGGFQPNLTLTYNSQIVDQASLAQQASWAGMGWSLDTGSIEVDTHGTNGTSDDNYYLNVGGISTQIVMETNGVYHTTDENFWKITRNGNTSWTIKDKQGNTYYFEETSTYPYQVGSCQQENAGVAWGTYRWSLSKVENIFGQQILYTYIREQKSVGISVFTGWCPLQSFNGVTAIYPQYITYAGGKYRVRFALEGRADYSLLQNAGPNFYTYERSRLSEIYVEQDADGNGAFETTLHRYDFTYKGDNESDLIFPGYWWNVINGVSTGKTTTLKSLQEYGVGGTAGLPAVSFTYGDNLHLTKVDNGYGGSVEFSYGLWYYAANARRSYTAEVRFGIAGYPCHTDEWYGWYPLPGGDVYCASAPGPLRTQIQGTYKGDLGIGWVQPGGVYKVAANINLQSILSSRLGLANGTSYTYPAAGNPPDIIRLPATASGATPVITFSGGFGDALVSYYKIQRMTSIYRVTTKQVKDGNGHTYTYTYSYQNGSGVDTAGVNDAVNSPTGTCDPANTGCYEFIERYSEFRGHAQVTETGPDGIQTVTQFHQDDILKGRPISTTVKVGSQTLSATLYTYVATSLPFYLPPGTVGLYRTFIYTSAVENRIYANNGTYTANRQVISCETTYGNLTTQTEQSWNGSAWVTYRSTEHNYFPNNSPTRYLVSLPGRVRSLDAAGNVLASTLFLYDGNVGDYQIPPVDGKLTAVRTRVSTDGVQWSQVSYGYDSWGNKTTVTTYSGYGASNTVPGTGAATTTTVYDSVFHVHPISQTTPPTANVPAGLVTTWNYDYDGNSSNDFILGVPTRETDPNGNQTSAQYDVFGRMTKLIRPGDSAASPTLSMAYQDSFPFTTTITQKIDSTKSYTVQRVYDGMGRQTRITSGGSIVDTVYQSPTVTKQSVPYFSGGTVYYTTTTLSPAARTTTVSAPNGTSTVTYTNGLATTFTDAKGYNTTSSSDVWGRVISVVPPSGPSVSYTYDELDRLKTALRGGVTTTLYYDNAGRKTSMSDPDMGNWTYAYDALGNLTRQTDARGQRICLYYDALNRLIGRHYRTDDNCPASPAYDVAYSYDLGTNGKGLRTSRTDGSGSASWTYDSRGRMVTEIKTISSNSYTTEWAYNSADLPTWMKYPDGEELTYGYNTNRLVTSITSSLGETYLVNIEYGPAGRIQSMDYGASVIRKTFNYFDWNTPDQGGLLNTAVTTRLTDQATLQNFAYTYDKNANVSTIIDNLAGPQTQSFGYDTLNRLTSAAVTGGTNGLYNESYSYESNTGNLSVKAGLTYTYDPNHPHAVTTLSNGNTYHYDANGNMDQRLINAQTFDLAYDAENRLVSVNTTATVPPTSTATATPSQTASPTATLSPTSTPTNTAGPSTATYTPSPTATNTATSTFTLTPVLATATPSPTPASDLIFADGFESGDFSAWSSTSTGGGDLSVSASAALAGSFGMQAVINDTTSMYTQDDSPTAEPRYRARFYFDPNSISMTDGNAQYIFSGSDASTVFQVDFRFSAGAYQLRVRQNNDGGGTTSTSWVTISDAPHVVEMEWRAASGVGANDGSVTLLIDDVQSATLTGIDNDTRRIDYVRLGAVSGIDAGTVGTYYLDAFESRRSTYIGPLAYQASYHFASLRLIPQQQSGQLTFPPIDDAYIESASPTLNHGTATTLQVDNSPILHFLLKFDVAGVNGQQVTNAKIRLYNTNSSTTGGDFYRVADNSWQEETVTWNNAPAADTTLLASLGSVSPDTWYEVDITSLITGDGTYSLRVSSTSTNGADYSSKEGANPPQLIITLGGTPSPTNTPTQTFTPSATATNTPVVPTNTATDTPVPPTATSTDTPVATVTPSLTPTNTQTLTNTPTITFTPTHTNTPTLTSTPTRTNTPTGATAIPNCSAVTHGSIVKSGNTLSMTITNPTGVSLVMQNVTVQWNHDKGHQLGIDKSLHLQQAALNSTIFWTGDNPGWILTITTNTAIPTGTSTIIFTFNQSYDNFDGTERIAINLATNGCEAYPIDTNPPTPTPTLTPTITLTPTVTPTNPATPTPPPASFFSHADFTYDGDGQRVQSEITTNLGTTTTYFVGAHYEVTDGVITKYYYAGGQRIAMRSNGTLYLLIGDHLGSTSLVTFANGNVVSETRYKAWGEERYSSAYTPTNYTYTGQFSYTSDFGLMFYGARWYDPSLGRFAQADTIIPEQGQGVQAWDRYAYTNNNPVLYTDPSGHCSVDGDDWCYAPTPPKKEKQLPPIPPKETGHLDSDEFGHDILKRYLTGGGDWYINFDPKWSEYMANNPTLKEDLELRAIENAQFMLDNGYSTININESYPMEIENGEAIIGYQYLHGTNQDVGGFDREGVASLSQASDGTSTVTFWMNYTWNDVVDPNPKYTTDVIKSIFAEVITLGKADAYEIHITWTQTIAIHLDSNGKVIP